MATATRGSSTPKGSHARISSASACSAWGSATCVSSSRTASISSAAPSSDDSAFAYHAHLGLEIERPDGVDGAGQLVPPAQRDPMLERGEIEPLAGVGVDGGVDATHVERQVGGHARLRQRLFLLSSRHREPAPGPQDRPHGSADAGGDGNRCREREEDERDRRDGGGAAGRQIPGALPALEPPLRGLEPLVRHLELLTHRLRGAFRGQAAEVDRLALEAQARVDGLLRGRPDGLLVAPRQPHDRRV